MKKIIVIIIVCVGFTLAQQVDFKIAVPDTNTVKGKRIMELLAEYQKKATYEQQLIQELNKTQVEIVSIRDRIKELDALKLEVVTEEKKKK